MAKMTRGVNMGSRFTAMMSLQVNMPVTILDSSSSAKRRKRMNKMEREHVTMMKVEV
jgi:hypothetical protein